MKRFGLVVLLISNICYRREKSRDALPEHIKYIFLCILLTGATVDSTLDGIRARPELYPPTAKKVPDVNFYYRYLLLFQIFFYKSKKCSALRFCLAFRR